jgi:hypothetical protein
VHLSFSSEGVEHGIVTSLSRDFLMALHYDLKDVDGLERRFRA